MSPFSATPLPKRIIRLLHAGTGHPGASLVIGSGVPEKGHLPLLTRKTTDQPEHPKAHLAELVFLIHQVKTKILKAAGQRGPSEKDKEGTRAVR